MFWMIEVGFIVLVFGGLGLLVWVKMRQVDKDDWGVYWGQSLPTYNCVLAPPVTQNHLPLIDNGIC